MKFNFPVDLSGFDRLDKTQYRSIIFGLLGLLALMVLIGVAVFFIAVEGEESTLVPDVTGKSLEDALVILQERELYPRLSLRYTMTTEDKGLVLAQNPQQGTIVKAGRRIELTVSRGTETDRVPNFVGRTIDDARSTILTMYKDGKPFLSLTDPPLYSFNRLPPGTIIEQRPSPDTPVSGPTKIDLVVSRGPEMPKLKVPDFSGLSISDAILLMEKNGVSCVFAMRKASGTEKQGIVIDQTPAAGTVIVSLDKVMITVTEPAAKDDWIAGVFTYALPVFPFPADVKLEAIYIDGTRSPIAIMTHSGGNFAIPYFLPAGTILVLNVMGKEVAKTEVRVE